MKVKPKYLVQAVDEDGDHFYSYHAEKLGEAVEVAEKLKQDQDEIKAIICVRVGINLDPSIHGDGFYAHPDCTIEFVEFVE